jgi:hypothetical protein
MGFCINCGGGPPGPRGTPPSRLPGRRIKYFRNRAARPGDRSRTRASAPLLMQMHACRKSLRHWARGGLMDRWSVSADHGDGGSCGWILRRLIGNQPSGHGGSSCPFNRESRQTWQHRAMIHLRQHGPRSQPYDVSRRERAEFGADILAWPSSRRARRRGGPAEKRIPPRVAGSGPEWTSRRTLQISAPY